VKAEAVFNNRRKGAMKRELNKESAVLQDNTIPVDDIIELASHTQIKRHTPGRIKLVLKYSGVKLIKKIDFSEVLTRIPGVLDTRVSILTRSVEVDYDPELLPYDLWEYLVRRNGSPELKEKIRTYLQILGEEPVGN
jgi:hypothetical protein